MNGFIINIDPVIFQFGGFQLRWYSVFILLATLVAVIIVLYRGRRKGLASDTIFSLLPWILIGGIFGARLLHVLDHFSFYVANPLQIIQMQQGGLAIWGALVGGGFAAIFYARVKGIPLGLLADVLAPALLAAQIIGRFGCVVNGDAYGGVTNLPWAFIYVHPGALIPAHLFGVPTHPYPLYEIVWNSTVLFAILLLQRRFARDGMLFLTYLSLYSAGRFLLTFVRQENILALGLQQAQIISLAVFILASLFLGMLYLRRNPRLNPSLQR